MNRIGWTILMLGLLFIAQNSIQAQGCSDAGFCTLNSFKPGTSEQEYKNQFKVGFSYGGADNAINVWSTALEYNRQIGKLFSVDAKLTTLAQQGNDISENDLSDLYLNANVKLPSSLRFTAGVKIPLNDADKSLNSLALPMDYQSSLGTLDLILGLGTTIKKLELVVAYQQPLTQNRNNFLAEVYPATSPLRNFQSTRQFQRSADVLLRVSYPIKAGESLRITPSVLPIYHLANDKFTNVLGQQVEIDGSQGLTLNGNVYVDYQINPKNAFQVNIGMPFVVRKSRPDGLTRSFVLSLEYRFRF